MARLLDVPLDDRGLRICYEMCKGGSVEPAALAVSRRELRTK